MSTACASAATPDTDPAVLAAAWFAHFATLSLASMPSEEVLPRAPHAVLAAFAAIALAAGRSVLILAPDDEPLPDISAALDLGIRPLCLVLPAADFAARIALRATLSLMKSRLARDDEEIQTAAWTTQQERIAAHPALWHAAQDWAARNDRSDWPERVADLFPVRVLPIAAFRALRQNATDITLLYRCDAPAELIALPGGLMRIGTCAGASGTRAVACEDREARLRTELAQLTLDVAEMELELATARAELAEFTRRYYAQVGRRMVELDALQARLAAERAGSAGADEAAQAAANEFREQAQRSARDAERFSAASDAEADVRRAGAETKRLFRRVAQQIHPDRAIDESDRAWRNQLMAEANRAYRAGDDRALKEVEALWREGRSAEPPAPGESADVAVARTPTLVRQVESMRERMAAIQRELQALFGSRLYELFLAARHAGRQGRDLLAEMAEKLDANIQELMRHLVAAG